MCVFSVLVEETNFTSCFAQLGIEIMFLEPRTVLLYLIVSRRLSNTYYKRLLFFQIWMEGCGENFKRMFS